MGSSGADAHTRYQPLHLDILAYALLSAGPVALLFRRRLPIAVLAATMTVTICYLLRGYVFGPVLLSPVAALFGAVMAGRRTLSWVVAGAGGAVLTVLGLGTPLGPLLLGEWWLGPRPAPLPPPLVALAG